MKIIKKIKKKIKNKVLYYPIYAEVVRRIHIGNEDLEKALPQARKISDEQRKEILSFWKPFLTNSQAKEAFDIRWFDVYNRTNVFGYDLKLFVPDGFYYGIVDYALSDANASKYVDDKNLYDLFFHDVRQPKTILRRMGGNLVDSDYQIITMEQAVRLCVENAGVIIKPSVCACAGRGITVWRKNSAIDELKTALLEDTDFVVQELVAQHKVLSDFNDSCVNTLRIVTLIWKGEVHVMSSVLIMGGKNEVKTNHLHQGGLVCQVLPSGRLNHTAFDGQLNEYRTHPNGVCFSDVVIPGFDSCVEIAKRLAPRLSSVTKIVNWDFTIGEDGSPILIEANLTLGGSVQIAAGPALGSLTEEVVKYAVEHRK